MYSIYTKQYHTIGGISFMSFFILGIDAEPSCTCWVTLSCIDCIELNTNLQSVAIWIEPDGIYL